MAFPIKITNKKYNSNSNFKSKKNRAHLFLYVLPCIDNTFDQQQLMKDPYQIYMVIENVFFMQNR